MANQDCDSRGFIAALVDDGRPLLTLTALLLVGFGLFALFLSATGQFLPHDVAFLGMTSSQLCGINECRIVHFMIHDRVSFGGTLIAVGTLYFWLIAFPLRQRKAWAWWLLLVSGLVGFASFLLYLSYGYLDTWHGVGTLLLLPFFAAGLYRTFGNLRPPLAPHTLFQPAEHVTWLSAYGIGRVLLLLTAVSIFCGGATIGVLGSTRVFVPEDLGYMGLTSEQLFAINPKLVPLIAHDRAGFGGGLCCAGITMLFCIWCGQPSPGLWQALLFTGLIGFGTAIGVHPAIGYTTFTHLLPAYTGALLFGSGLILTARRMHSPLPAQLEAGTFRT
jgi:hypothetical protein